MILSLYTPIYTYIDIYYVYSDKLNNDVQGYIQIRLEGGLRQKKGLIVYPCPNVFHI